MINKITFEYWQEADNDVGSESLEIIVNPALIGLFKDNGEINYFFTLKSEDGFSFDDSKELIDLIKNIETTLNNFKTK